MALVFPNALAANTTNIALARGAFWFAHTFLASTIICLAIVGNAWQATPVLLPINWLVLVGIGGVILATPAAHHSALIILGGVLILLGNTLYAAAVIPHLDAGLASDTAMLAGPKIAIVMFGVVVGRWVSGVITIPLAYVVAEGPVLIVSLLQDHPLAVDVATTVFAIVLLLILLGLRTNRKRTRASEPAINSAIYADDIAAERSLAEGATSALIHDTILNELAVIATLPPGELAPATRVQMQRSIDLLVDHNAFGAVVAEVPEFGGDIATAVQEARRLGLTVLVNGDTTTASQLAPDVSRALGLAILQCLTNVHVHSGSLDAELSLIATEGELCAMVIDAGVGFVEANTADDRLGLRQSVRGRLAAVGGSVQVWSAPGAGTAVSMLVPRR
ncbi:MAG: Two-component system, sensor protein [Glaciihabitans sp.]|nr:Two-component system, sensor protein [Glaciihabitans sp.]